VIESNKKQIKMASLSENQKTLLLIVVAFIFSFAVRMIWVVQFSDQESFKYNNEFMINTNDGYFWAEGARDILAGSHEPNDLSPVDYAASQLTAFLSQILPISFETLIFYMPAFLGSLIVIPIILIARSFHTLEIGFIASLIGSIAVSYYNRTMVGYYDTDMLTIVFPAFLLWSLIWAVRMKEPKYLLFVGFEIITYRWWYEQSYALDLAFFAVVALYTLYQFVKKEEIRYELKLLATILLAMVYLSMEMRFALVIGIYFVARMELPLKYLYALLGGAFMTFLITGGINPVMALVKGYIFRETTSTIGEGLRLQFFNVAQTVREAGEIPFETFAERISGHIVSFVVAVAGYVWFAWNHRAMWLALPMVGLGFMAYGIPGVIDGGGLRFTVYAVPAMALGLGYVIVEVAKMISDTQLKRQELGFYLIVTLLTALALYPNIVHIQEYKVPTVFDRQEVETLEKFHKIATREDYVVTWWDYGYPIRYYSDVKVLVDGGKHTGDVNFAPSFVLTSPQQTAANMARLEVEYTEKRFKLAESNGSQKMASSNTEQMTLDYGFKDANHFLSSLETPIALPVKTRDVYLYLPYRMMDIFPTVALFSNLDLHTGKEKKNMFFFKGGIYGNNNGVLDLGRGITFDAHTNEISFGQGQTSPIKYFIMTKVENGKTIIAEKQLLNRNATLSLIFMESYGAMLVVNDDMLKSSYIQLFVLESYDPKLYEPVILDSMTKIYKLKI